MTSRFAAAAVVVGALLIPASASAQEDTGRYASAFPGQHRITNPVLLGYRDRAIDFWTRRGYPVPCVPTFDVADSLALTTGSNVTSGSDEQGRTALARTGDPAKDCRIIIQARLAGEVAYFHERAKRPIRSMWRRMDMRRALADFCRIVTHEVGHTAGLAWPTWGGSSWVDGHPSVPSVMSNSSPTIPGSCWQHARATIRQTAA
jgi:hypothetical protein